MDSECPIYGDNHKYFMFKTTEVFEPIPADALEATMPRSQLYVKREYGVLGCNCGAVLKQVITQGSGS